MIPLYTESEFNQAKTETKLPLQCEYCYTTFYYTKRSIKSGLDPNHSRQCKYCSPKCAKLAITTSQLISCKQCGTQHNKQPSVIKKNNNSFCSQSCAATYNNTHKTYGTRISKLEKYLKEQLESLYNFPIKFNSKEEINSELDIYIPHLKLAFEINGIFHYEPIYGQDKLDKIQNNDNRKFQACLEQGIEFCIIDSSQQKYFKESTSKPFLDIICDIINQSQQNKLYGHSS